MSLTGREQRILNSIRDGLASSDPGLAQLMSTFARLTAGEDMPACERVRLLRRRAVRRGGARLGTGPVLLLLWLAVTIALISLAVVLGSGPPACPRVSVAGCLSAGAGRLPNTVGSVTMKAPAMRLADQMQAPA
jgi:hypothetical protein